jgi:hypothetical protein
MATNCLISEPFPADTQQRKIGTLNTARNDFIKGLVEDL